MTKHYLYHICRNRDVGNYGEGYIGITNNPTKRFTKHRWEATNGSSFHLHRAIRRYEDLTYTILIISTRSMVDLFEQKLRPYSGMGWNMSAGGDCRPALGIKPSTETLAKRAKAMEGKHLGRSSYNHGGFIYVTPFGSSCSLTEVHTMSGGIPRSTLMNRCKSLNPKFSDYFLHPMEVQ